MAAGCLTYCLPLMIPYRQLAAAVCVSVCLAYITAVCPVVRQHVNGDAARDAALRVTSGYHPSTQPNGLINGRNINLWKQSSIAPSRTLLIWIRNMGPAQLSQARPRPAQPSPASLTQPSRAQARPTQACLAQQSVTQPTLAHSGQSG